MKEVTLMGKILAHVHSVRAFSRETAIAELWERNGLGNPSSRRGYKLAETKNLQVDGTEVTEYRLYKIVDATVTVKAEVRTEVTSGLDGLKENRGA